MIGKLDDYLRFNELALGLRAQRQNLLASNIANGDTPNYKARDIDFNAALQDALVRTQPPAGVLATTQAGHIDNANGNPNVLPDGTPVLYRVPTQAAADGNTVEMDTERAQFADNALRYEAGLTMINMQIKGVLAAIQGGN